MEFAKNISWLVLAKNHRRKIKPYTLGVKRARIFAAAKPQVAAILEQSPPHKTIYTFRAAPQAREVDPILFCPPALDIRPLEFSNKFVFIFEWWKNLHVKWFFDEDKSTWFRENFSFLRIIQLADEDLMRLFLFKKMLEETVSHLKLVTCF